MLRVNLVKELEQEKVRKSVIATEVPFILCGFQARKYTSTQNASKENSKRVESLEKENAALVYALSHKRFVQFN